MSNEGTAVVIEVTEQEERLFTAELQRFFEEIRFTKDRDLVEAAIQRSDERIVDILGDRGQRIVQHRAYRLKVIDSRRGLSFEDRLSRLEKAVFGK